MGLQADGEQLQKHRRCRPLGETMSSLSSWAHNTGLIPTQSLPLVALPERDDEFAPTPGGLMCQLQL